MVEFLAKQQSGGNTLDKAGANHLAFVCRSPDCLQYLGLKNAFSCAIINSSAKRQSAGDIAEITNSDRRL